MFRIAMLVLCCLTLVGCGGPHYVDFFPYHDDGTMKPRVALVPVFDSSKSDVPWSLSQELTQGMRYKIMDHGDLYLLSREELGPCLSKMSNLNVMGSDFSFLQNFDNTDFVVLMDLFQHEVIPPKKNVKIVPGQINPGCYTLNLKMRIRIFDIRSCQPEVVLQEIISQECAVPSDISKKMQSVPYGSEAFSRTCYGQAHQVLVDKAVRRIEEASWGAK